MSESKQSPERVDAQGKKVKRIGNFSLAVAAAVLATASGHASTVRPATGTLLPQDMIGTSQDVPVLLGNFSGPLLSIRKLALQPIAATTIITTANTGITANTPTTRNTATPAATASTPTTANTATTASILTRVS